MTVGRDGWERERARQEGQLCLGGDEDGDRAGDGDKDTDEGEDEDRAGAEARGRT